MTIVKTPTAPHPQARIDSVDAATGVCIFAWLDANAAPVDSGGSVARFEPVAIPATDPVQYAEPSNETLAAAVENPPAEPGQTIFTYSEFVAYCDAKVAGFSARILVACRASTAVQNWVNVAVSRNRIELDAPDLAVAFGQFVAAGLMSDAERTAILTP
jgi:hypothetical protein